MKSALMNRRLLAVGIAALGMAVSAPRSQADAAGQSVSPSKTTVLLLPAVEEPSDMAKFAGLHEAIAVHRMEYEFLTRQFTAIGPSMAAAEARKAGVDLVDPAKRNTDTLKKMAELTHADWVVSIDVIEVKHDIITPGNRTDHAKIHVLVYDAKSDSVLADKDVIKTRNSAGVNLGVLGLMTAAIDTTAQAAFANLLKPYPQTVKVANEDGNDDYLYGQTKAVTGDPGKLFTAMATPPTNGTAVQVN